jgi:argininosuccinate lyase
MTLWGGRFTEPPSDVLWRYTVDRADRRLLIDDVTGSLAHVAMLGAAEILPAEEVATITAGLRRILAEAEGGEFGFVDGDEDVHSAVERRLVELVGEVGGKLHTGRSRNDQVALDLRLYLRRAAGARADQVGALALSLATLAGANADLLVPVFTHLQQAQPVSFGHHLMAHAWSLLRDRDRFLGCMARLDVSPLGAGAAGGSSLPLQPDRVASKLGMAAVFDNSIDAVAGRDVVTEYAFCSAQAMAGLSRLAEELVLWATTEFGWATYDERTVTGSSALPQKQNPDIAELARGRAATVLGDVTALLALQKGLPLAYQRDLQEDKSLVFHADDTLAATLEALGAMLAGARFHPPPPSGSTAALDLAERLTGRGVPFRRAHQAVGRLVAALDADGRDLGSATGDDLAADPLFEPDDLEAIDPERSVAQRRSPGGGSVASVHRQIAELRRRLSG